MSRLEVPLVSLIDAVDASWQPVLRGWAASPAGRATLEAVDRRVVEGAVVYPARVFRALELTPFDAVRVVILGQDPYHGPGQAEGLAFSVPVGQRIPPSLRNIHRELARDLGLSPPPSGSLLPWARRGVLLLNTCLTVEDGQAGSHAKLGWQVLTDTIVLTLAENPAPKVFMLWGAHAQAKATLVPPGAPHLVLSSNHPSPLSALRPPVPFVGNGHFGAASRFLDARHGRAMDWSLT